MGAGFALALYAAANAVAVFVYDASAFPLSYRVRYGVINGCTGLLIACVAWVALARMYRDYRLERDVPNAERTTVALRLARTSRRSALGVCVALAAVLAYLQISLPLVERRGLPGLPASERLSLDRLSRRPTVDVRTNEYGFRDRPWLDRERPLENPAFRVLLLGDSITFGSGIREQAKTLTARLERALAADGRVPWPQVFNVSLNGLNFTQQVDLLAAFVGDVNPDLVVVVHNEQNDLMPPLPYYSHPRLFAALPLAFVTYVNALDRYMGSHLLSDSPGRVSRFQQDSERLARLGDERSFDVLFTYLVRRCPPAYYTRTKGRARLFAYSTVGQWPPGPELTFPNDFHPNEEGVVWIAERLAPRVRRIADEGATWRSQGVDPITEEFESGCVRGEPRREEPSAARSPTPPASATGGTVAVQVLPPDAGTKLLAATGHALGDLVSGGWKMDSLRVDGASATLTLTKDGAVARMVLDHRSTAGPSDWQSTSFHMKADVSGAAGDPAAMVALQDLAKRIDAADRGGFFIEARSRPR